MSNLISEAELIRHINIPYPRFQRAVKKGLVVPDEIVSSRLRLFKRSRIDSIRLALQPKSQEVTA